ncbi:MAG TPA: ankyrin repeat domain-containing protein [Candidatus Eisenbacteria bacterium]
MQLVAKGATLLALLLPIRSSKAAGKGPPGPEGPATQLHALVEASDIAGLRSALQANPALVNAQDKDGGTLLMHAAYLKNEEIVRLLVERGAEVRAADKWGATALHFAARPGGRSVCELLLAKGASIDPGTRPWYLHWSAHETPFDFAAGAGAADVLDLLMERGANPNGGSADWKPLCRVARHGLRGIVERMIAAGAQVDARDINGETALFWVAQGGVTRQEEVVMAHLAHQEAPTYLKGDFVGVAEALIRAGCDVNAVNKNRTSALFAAVEVGRADVANVLLAHGAKMDARDRRGVTPLHTAAGHRQTECVRTLLEHGAPVDAADVLKWTPLVYLANDSYSPKSAVPDSQGVAVAALLIEHGANVNWKTSGGGWGFFREDYGTPLEFAARHGSAELAAALLRAGADPNPAKKHGHTALQGAVRMGYSAIADTLRAHGAVR